MNNILENIKQIVKRNSVLRRIATPFIDKNLQWKYFSWRNKPFNYSLLNGEKVALYPHGQIARGVFSGWFELDDIIKFQKLIKPGMTVIDVGANIGLYSIIASKLVGEKGKVYSFEPSKKTYELFINNLKLNFIDNCVPYNIGLGDTANENLQLIVDSGQGDADKYMIPNTIKGKELTDGDQSVEVEEILVNRLDDVLINANIEQVDFIKIDTEGFEYFIVNGGQEILKNSENLIVLMECTYAGTNRVGVTQDMVYSILKNCGLKLFYWDKYNNLWSDDEEAAKSDGMIWACKNERHLLSILK